MENKAHALAAGIFVVLLTALVLGLAAWLTRDTGVARHLRDLHPRDRHRPAGAGAGALSRRRRRQGVAGRLRPQGASATCWCAWRSTARRRITRDTFATLSYQGVTGLAFIQLADEGKPAPRAGARTTTMPPRIPLRPGLLAQAGGARRGDPGAGGAGDRARQPAAGRRQPEAHRQRRWRTSASAADSTSQLAARLDSTVAQRLDPALAEATATLRSVQQRGRPGRAAAASEFGQTAQRLNAHGRPDRPAVARAPTRLSHAAEQLQRRHAAAREPRGRRGHAHRAHAGPRRQRTDRQPAGADLRRRRGAARAGRAGLPGAGRRADEPPRCCRSCCWPLAAGGLQAAAGQAGARGHVRLRPAPPSPAAPARRPAPPLVLPDVEVERRRWKAPALLYRLALRGSRTSCGPTPSRAGARRPAQLVRQRLREVLGPRARRCSTPRAAAALARRGGARAAGAAGGAGGVQPACSTRQRDSRGVLRLRCTLLENTRRRRAAGGAAQLRGASARRPRRTRPAACAR